jgi:hypothetical protein
MRLRFPSRKACRLFHLTYELEGAQRAVNYLTRYYRVKRLKLVVDGRKVIATRAHKKYAAHYYRSRAYFVKKFLKRKIVLHELFHHLIDQKQITMPLRQEERDAERFARFVMKKRL